MRGASQHVIGLFADDIVLTLKDTRTSLPLLLELLHRFGQLSGFTINWTKYVFVSLSDSLDSGFLNSLSFKISCDHFVYLRINITIDSKHLFQ